MVHCLHDRGFVLENVLRLLREPLLGNDFERRLLLGDSVLDEKHNTKGTDSEQVAHTEHISEAVELLALRLAIFIQERLREAIIISDPDFAHQNMITIIQILTAFRIMWFVVLVSFLVRTMLISHIPVLFFAKHFQTVDIETLLQDLLYLLALLLLLPLNTSLSLSKLFNSRFITIFAIATGIASFIINLLIMDRSTHGWGNAVWRLANVKLISIIAATVCIVPSWALFLLFPNYGQFLVLLRCVSTRSAYLIKVLMILYNCALCRRRGRRRGSCLLHIFVLFGFIMR